MVKLSDIAIPHLQAWRAERGLTQNELARLAGVSRGTVLRAERGGAVNIVNATKIAKALGASVRQLQDEEPTGSRA